MTLYRNGSSAGVGGGNPSPKKRDVIKGWSSGAVRRHTKWLYGIEAENLDGRGYAYTLTLRRTPASAAEFHSMRTAWIKRLVRAGAIRTHWVIEWQRRGTPHIHAAVYFASTNVDPYEAIRPVLAWVELADDYGAALQGQHYDTIDGALGWLKYLSKHAARGVKHYQRQSKPPGWVKTGRLWGHTGEWPEREPLRFETDMTAYWRYRRLIRAWRVADARASGDPRRISYARRMLKCNDRHLSSVRGVSDWTDEGVSLALLALLIDEGHEVRQREE